MDHQSLKIWFAGFYEGEGSVSNDTNNRNRLKIMIAQNDRTPLDIGQKIWGGVVVKRIRKSPASDKICVGHEWKINHKQSIKFLDDIKPYMLIPYKINQIKKCMEKLEEEWTKRFECSFCDNDFADASGRRRHEKSQHINKSQKHKCETCKKTYATLDSMKRHMKLNHTSVASVTSK